MSYAIKYNNTSTVNGEKVGVVFAVDIGHISRGCWTYTRDPKLATTFDTCDAAASVAAKHRWSESVIVTI